MLTPPDTWSCPTLGLASVLMLRPISPELVLFLDFRVSNIPRYFCFCLDINWFYKNCLASLCETCKEEHSAKKFLRDHNVVQRTCDVIRTPDSLKVTEVCPEHTESEITGRDCDLPCCMRCIELKHQRHAISAIATKYIECEDKINELAKNLEKRTLQDLKTKKDELRKNLKLHKQTFEEVVGEVNKFRTELKTVVDKTCDTILGDIKQRETDQTLDIKKTRVDLEIDIEDTECFISLVVPKLEKVAPIWFNFVMFHLHLMSAPIPYLVLACPYLSRAKFLSILSCKMLGK